MSFLYGQLLEVTGNPMLLALFVLLGTYVLEDAAIVTAALLTADGLLPASAAFLALFIGIFTGDIGLYVLGRYLNRFPYLKSFLDLKAFLKARFWLDRKMTTTVLLVRIIPGLRLPVYAACGFFNLSFKLFAILVLVASLVWTAVVFYGFVSIGSMFWSELGYWKWTLLPAIIGLIMVSHRKIKVAEGLFR